jgi:hypothetical protein
MDTDLLFRAAQARTETFATWQDDQLAGAASGGEHT